jgi:FtsZ-interacting cell division protein YlmF
METPFGLRLPEVLVMTPARFEDAPLALQAVQELKTVVLHLGSMDPIEAQRVIDFVSGGVWPIRAAGGNGVPVCPGLGVH